jgi:hypothetical protein
MSCKDCYRKTKRQVRFQINSRNLALYLSGVIIYLLSSRSFNISFISELLNSFMI